VPATPPGQRGPDEPSPGEQPSPDEQPADGPARRGRVWSVLLPAVLLLAGVLFATSANTSSGTDLRGGRHDELQQLISARNGDVNAAQRRAAELQDQIDTATQNRAKTDARLKGPRAEADGLKGAVGLVAVSGPAVTVRMDDAPRNAEGSLPAGAGVDDVVVHQQDVQAVVNALWAGGAEAMTIMGERVISTSAVRCVGNTLLLHGRTFSPPFVITAIGDQDRMRESLDRSPGVLLFREAARDFGLGYRVTTEAGEVMLPAYKGPLSITHATNPSR
jgi:uncharacterized protein YlxW (UPF0749 family)